MKVALWAEIRRLAEIDKLSGRAIARRLHCSRHTVAAALKLQQPPAPTPARRASVLDPYLEQIQDLLARYPDLSAVRIREEIARGPQGYTGSTISLRRYLRQVRPARGRVYQEVHYETGPGHAGRLGRLRPCSGRGHDPQGLGVRGRALLQPLALHRVHPVAAQGRVLPRPGQRPDLLRRQSTHRDLRQPQGGRAQRLRPPRLLPSRVPGLVRLLLSAAGRLRPPRPGIERDRGGGRALRQAQRPGWPGRRTAPLRGLPGPGAHLARSGGQRAPAREPPASGRIDRFEQERALLRPLPAIPFDTDEVVPAVVSPHARVAFDGNRYSAPPQFVRRPITLRANRDELRLLHEGQVVAQHVRSYERGQLLVLPSTAWQH